MRMRIVAVEDGKFDKPDSVFDDGSKLSANPTNVKNLIRAYGGTDADWVGNEIELRIGELEYGGNLKETVVIKPITPPVEKKPPEPRKGAGRDADDEIPF